MAGYQPPFSITPLILNQVITVGELLGRWAAQAERASPLLRKENRIRTIQASLAIEQNSLSTQQVTDIIEGKRVLAPPKDIQEVRNALQAYEKLPTLDSTSRKDLLATHQILMKGLVDYPGVLRQGEVGIYREKQLIHMAPPANQLNRLVNELLDWLKHTDLHPLIASSIFHYEFEFIHPFADGNGRMGRLWQTLMLSQWRSELAWLPVETLIFKQQQDYYRVLGVCDRASDCTVFISFMLEKLIEALNEGISEQSAKTDKMSVNMSVKPEQGITRTAAMLLTVLKEQPAATRSELAEHLGISLRTIERNLKLLQEKNKIERIGTPRNGHWIIT